MNFSALFCGKAQPLTNKVKQGATTPQLTNTAFLLLNITDQQLH